MMIFLMLRSSFSPGAVSTLSPSSRNNPQYIAVRVIKPLPISATNSLHFHFNSSQGGLARCSAEKIGLIFVSLEIPLLTIKRYAHNMAAYPLKSK